MNKMLFCHDHIFFLYRGGVYSSGKLDREKFNFYFNFCESITVVGRQKKLDVLPPNALRVDVDGVDFYGVENLSSLKGGLARRRVSRELRSLIVGADCLVVRLPSEIGLLALSLANKLSRTAIAEVVASGGDCLRNRGDFISKLYAPVLDFRVRQHVKGMVNVIYVTHQYLQSCYPSQSVLGVSDVKIDSVTTARPAKECGFRIGVIGNPDLKLKGIHSLICAISLLRKRGVDIDLSVVGGSGERYILENGALPNGVVFEGVITSRSDISHWFRGVDAYVQPSLTEGLPRSLIEAMSFGLPCFGSNVGGIPELLDEAALFSAGDTLGIVGCLELLSDPESYKRLSEYSVSKAFEYLYADLSRKRFSFYASAVNAKPTTL